MKAPHSNKKEINFNDKHKAHINKHSFLRTLSLIKYDKKRMILSIAITILVSLISSLIMLLQRPIYNLLSEKADWQSIVPYILAFPMVIILSNIFALIANWVLIRGSQNIMYKLRSALCNKLQYLPIPFYDQHSHGDLMSTFTNDTDRLLEFFSNTWGNLGTSVIQIIVYGLILTIMSWQMMLVLVCFLIIPIFLSKSIAKLSAKYFVNQQRDIARMNGLVEELMEGQKVVRAYGHEDESIKDFQNINNDLCNSSSKAQTFATLLMPLMGNIGYFQYATLAFIGGYLTLKSTIDLGTLITFLSMSRSISQPISQIANTFNSIAQAVAGAERIFAILDEENEKDTGKVTSKDGKWQIPQDDGSIKEMPIKGSIKMENVYFSYVPGKVVLKDISLWANPAERIALVGSTGAGKTTITNMLNRFYEIDSGTITYDGINIQDIKKSDLRRAMSLVLQEVHLFKGTIKDNIRFGRLDASDDEIIEAAKAANAHHFIMSLEKNYDTELLADGANLSQGQRQLLAIARAAIASPPVLILDEATSSIDTRTEKLIEKGMDKLIENTTTFAIAHRLSTVRSSNAIMVMENGEIIERGTHDDLMALKGTYYNLNTGVKQLS